MSLPSEIIIGPLRVPVDVVKDLKAYGECDFEAGRIRISSDLGPEVAKLTLIHEAMHMILELSTLRNLFSVATSEALVNVFSIGCTQLVKDNPGIFDI